MTTREKLFDLAFNLRWSWQPGLRDLFRKLDPEVWEDVEQNPVALLRRIDPSRLDGEELDAPVGRAWSDLREYLEADAAPLADPDGPSDRPLTAYFSAEYGIADALRIYSGGLGVLAGDHLKSASDLGLPLVAVGLFYREGYFRQEVGARGRQRERFPAADMDDQPLRPVEAPDGRQRTVAIPFPGRRVWASVWRADVGRVPLFLLDTDVEENDDDDRGITARLYGGDNETRIQQEIVLGIGGYRALKAMGIRPRSVHMNEGHSAFLGLEVIRDVMEAEGLEFEEARQTARRRAVFTTHTPVPAGHDRFSPDLMARYFTEDARGLGLDMDGLMALGRAETEEGAAEVAENIEEEVPASDASGDGGGKLAEPEAEPFTMTILAINTAERTNGVSRLHGRVSREMWHHLWPDREVEAVPIDHITNGVHLPTWMAPEIVEVCGPDPQDAPDPDPERLWAVHQRLRHGLIDWLRDRGVRGLDRDALTIAFARRFATYKRATLLLEDADRLAALLADGDRPVQLIFSGKAHPKDEGGKALIRRIVELSRKKKFRNRLAFIPDYGIDVARELVKGADVWLNNPRRPKEASGTSGMKAAANGVLNVSVLDGWWDEAYQSARENGVRIGWAIGEGMEAETEAEAAADRADLESMFRVLGDEVIPTFYDRSGTGVPETWATMMRDSIREVAPVFNTDRMVSEYARRYRSAAASDQPTGALGSAVG